jgi:hypothetical protein
VIQNKCIWFRVLWTNIIVDSIERDLTDQPRHFIPLFWTIATIVHQCIFCDKATGWQLILLIYAIVKKLARYSNSVYLFWSNNQCYEYIFSNKHFLLMYMCNKWCAQVICGSGTRWLQWLSISIFVTIITFFGYSNRLTFLLINHILIKQQNHMWHEINVVSLCINQRRYMMYAWCTRLTGSADVRK